VAERAAPSARPGWRRYEPVWSVRRVRRAFTGTLIARTAQTMMPLTLLLLFRERTGSFTAAGVAVAAFGLAFVAGGPVTARLADRWGTWVMAGAGAVSAASLVLLGVTASPVASWLAVVIAGVSVPPLTSALRAAIVVGLTAEGDRAAAFSLDAIATELLFVAGPGLVAAAAALGAVADALFVAAGLVVVGSAVITRAAGRDTRRSHPVAAAGRPSRARQAALLAPWLAVGAAQMGAIGFVEVAVTARVVQLGDPAAAGTVLAVWAAGSIAGGLTYGGRDWPGSAVRQLRVLLLLLAVGLAMVTAAATMALLYPLMFAAGIACAPAVTALTTSFSAAGTGAAGTGAAGTTADVPASVRANRTERFAWLASSTSLGGSAGYAAAGLLLAHATITTTILAGAALAVVAAIIVPASLEKGEHTPRHFQHIAHRGACGKTRVLPHNRRPRPEPTEILIGADGVNSLTASAFDLPDNLAAKADPALIAGDEQHFAAIAKSLEQSIADLSDRLDAERKAPGGIGQKALDRDMEIHRLTARLRTLRRFGLDLCLGRIVSAGNPEPVYIGRLGLRDRAGRRLLVDWRSPAAEPFFGATHANPMGLASRRRYRWTRGRISDYWDEVFTPDGLDGHAALDDQSAFIASLGADRSDRMRDVLGTIAADQDAIIRAGSRGALVVDGGPGTGKTVVALHRTAYLLYADPRLGHNRGGVLFIGPHQPYLAYVSDVLPSLGEEGVQTCTLRDLVPEGAAAKAETDPDVARLKSSADLVEAIEAAVRFYETPPATGMAVETHWSDIWLDAADWAEAFGAPEPGTPHNEARYQVWEELLSILMDKLDHDDVPADQLRRSLQRNEGLRTTFSRAWPLLEATDLVGDLWSVPAYLRKCAPWLSPAEVQRLQRRDTQAWTVCDLPLLDAARHRLGDPETSRRERRRAAAVAAEREQMTRVVDNLIEAADDEYGIGLVTMLRGEDFQDALVDQAALPVADRDLLAGPFAHIVVDEAQELTDAQWQMLLLRCPSRSFTIVGDRAQARHGFTESWRERLERIGLDQVNLASLSINYRTPEEVMAEAEPVIRAVLPDANVPVSIRATGVPVIHGAASDLGPVLDSWLSAHAEGIACVIGDPTFPATSRVRSLTPELSKGLEFDLVVLVDPGTFGEGIEGAVDRYVAMTRATQRLVILTSS
jgi:hypothetical protein